MADTKISALTELTTPDPNDLLVIVDDPSGTPVTKKITATNLSGILYQDGTHIGVSGTVAPTSIGSWTVPGGFLRGFGGLHGLLTIHLGHAIAGTASFMLVYGGVTGTINLSLSQGSFSAEKPGQIEFTMMYITGSSQNNYAFAYADDGGSLYQRYAFALSSINSETDQNMTLLVQWNTASNGLAFRKLSMLVRAI